MTPPSAEVILVTDSQYAYHVLLGDWHLIENLDIVSRIQRLAAARLVSAVWMPRCSDEHMRLADRLSREVREACDLTNPASSGILGSEPPER